MGMFDYIVCDYPLPEGAPREGWQTKGTPNQYLDKYTITEDGRLLDPEGRDTEYHGDLNFYTSNWAAFAHFGYMTVADEPWAGFDFVARFTDGRLASLTGGSTDAPNSPHLTHDEWNKKHQGDWRKRNHTRENETP